MVVAQVTSAEQLIISSWGGRYSDSQRAAYYQPFEQEFGVRILEDHWGGNLDKLRAMIRTNIYRAHVLDGESKDLVAACEEGLLHLIDYVQLGLAEEDLLPGAAHRCGVGTVAWSLVLAYRKAIWPDEVPAGWADFWDLEQYPGLRGMRRGATGNLEIALLAAGTEPSAVYPLLRTPRGVDRAFRMLDKLKRHIRWWEAGAQPERWLIEDEVTMSTAWHGRIVEANQRSSNPLSIVWQGQLMDYDYWMIPKDHPQLELALKFVKFASAVPRQLAQSRLFPYGPLNIEASRQLDDRAISNIPTHPANLGSWLKVDASFWLDNGAGLEERFVQWSTSPLNSD